MNGRKEKRTFLLAIVIIGILSIAGCNSAGSGDDTVAGIPGASAVDLGTAGDFVILAESGIDTTGGADITGDIGVSPLNSTSITGFSLIGVVASDPFLTSGLVTGNVYAANLFPPTPTKMTTAISDMHTAYTNAANRTLPDFTELASGLIGGMTLAPGLYKWGTGVNITADVTLSGSSTDYWIFQIGDTLTVGNGVSVLLIGSALPENIYWQVSSGATLGTTSHFEGILMAKSAITLDTTGTVNGRLMAQTAVNLADNVVTQP